MNDLGLHLITLEVTTECNLNCIHCYQDRTLKIASNHKSIAEEDIECIKRELETVTPHYLILSGGEPLIIGKRLFYIAKEMRNYCRKLFLTTNGQLVRNYPASLFNIFDGVQISLDGPKEIHEMIRGKGTFEEAIYASRYLKNEEISVSFLMALHALNMNYIEQTYEIARSFNAPFGVERVSPVGDGKNVKPIDINEWKDSLKLIVNKNIGCGDPLAFIFKKNFKTKLNPNKITGGCMAGVASLTITTSLDILPCVRLRMSVGNLKNSSLRDIWINSSVLKKFRNRSAFKGKCGVCNYRNICGGCRTDAYAKTGDCLGSDPLCWIEEKR